MKKNEIRRDYYMEKIDGIEFSNKEGSLYAFSQEALEFLSNKKWCKKIEYAYLAEGIEGILGIFKFFIIPENEGTDKELWVIVGDIPPAYLVTDYAPDAVSALKVYVDEMQLWVDASLSGKPVDKLIPVNVPSNKENAKKLRIRLDFIVNKLIPELEKTQSTTNEDGEVSKK